MESADTIQKRYAHRLGEQFGQLTFHRISERRGDNNRVLGKFRCECGRDVEYPLSRMLRGGYRKHCGCQTDRGSNRTHGMHGSPEYASWKAMKIRCLAPSNKDYPRYGARGITVHQEWRESFEAFLAEVGPRPAGTSLDRIDNTKGYEPGNVRWATPVEQQRNRASAYRWMIKGRLFETAEEASKHFRVSKQTIWRWVNGEYDRRRGTFTPAREDCHVEPRY